MTNPLVDLHQAICQNSRTDRLIILGPRDIEMDDEEEKPTGVVAYLVYVRILWVESDKVRRSIARF